MAHARWWRASEFATLGAIPELRMASRRSFASSWLTARLVAVIVLGTLVVARAATAEPLAPANATGTPTDAIRLEQPAMSACAGPYTDALCRDDDAYVFAATRSVRQAGIHPAIGVMLAPATLAVDVVFFPFAVALEHLANASPGSWRAFERCHR
jgi:hypothetical protein